MRAKFLASIALITMVSPVAHAGPVTQDACSGTFSAPIVWQHVGTPSDLLENLLFSHGSLFVSDQTAGALLRFDTQKHQSTVTTVSSPGGLVDAPDGGIYVGFGDSVPSAEARNGAAGVLHLPADLSTPTTYASGLNMVNGVTIDTNGNLYVSNDVDTGLYEIPASDPSHPKLLNDTWGTNGLVVGSDGKTLYSAITFDQRSPIEATDLATPASHHTAFQLSAGAVSLQPAAYTDGDTSKPLVGLKGLDDMTSDGRHLYVVANGMGELLRVDLQDGSSCLIASGLQNPSSVRIAPPGSGFEVAGAQRTFYVTEFDGAIKQIVQS